MYVAPSPERPTPCPANVSHDDTLQSNTDFSRGVSVHHRFSCPPHVNHALQLK